MKVNSIEEVQQLLSRCKAVPYTEVKDGGSFYRVKAQSFKFPDGSIQTREFLNKKESSIVVPVTDEGDFVGIIQPIALSEEGSLLEFPAGYWELNENGLEAGIRELSEETGYVPENIVYLGSHYQDPGSIKQKVDCYLALGCTKVTDQHLDKGEYIKQIVIPYNLITELLEEGYFMDANSFIALNKSITYLEKKLKIGKSL